VSPGTLRQEGNEATQQEMKPPLSSANHLTKKDIPKIVKKILEAFNESDTESDDKLKPLQWRKYRRNCRNKETAQLVSS